MELDFGTAVVKEQTVRESIRCLRDSRRGQAARQTWLHPLTVG